jgi:histidine triad (HIT) family protein
MSEPSIFTRIINGDIPAYKVYEDEKTLAFLDISPAAEGHTLVIPKTEVEFVWDLADEEYAALMATVKKVGLRLREVIGTPYVGEMVVGTDVPHAHIHLVPFSTATELKRAAEGDRPVADQAELAELAARLAF